jgi:hypothetical protein
MSGVGAKASNIRTSAAQHMFPPARERRTKKPPNQSANFSFHSCVGNAAGASGLKNAESWMCDVVT